MKTLTKINWILTLILCFTISNSSFAFTAKDTLKLKVLSYNLRFGELASLEELAEFIKEQDPDIVALQEVDNRTFREAAPKQHDKDFATELGYRTGMMSAYGKTIDFAGGYYGIAILSKYPMAKVERFYLPKTEHGEEQRALLVADIEYGDNKFFTFANTHLDYTHTKERQVQVDQINKILETKVFPVILAGDFNAEPDAVEIEEGMESWERLSLLDPTFPTKEPRVLIDYIFSYPEDRWEKVEAETPKVDLSDHLPIQVEVLMLPKESNE